MQLELRSWTWIFVASLVVGCGGEPSPPGDAGPDAHADAEPDGDGGRFVPDPPAPPAPPEFGTCPEGWQQSEGAGGGCEPWPAAETPPECADDEARFVGQIGCERVGSTCPAGDWAEDLPAEGVVAFIRAGAPAGGDGTREAPFATIAEGVAAAVTGGVIAVGRGSYDEAVRLTEGVTLWGACVAETLLTNSTGFGDGVVTIQGGGTNLRNLRIGEGYYGVVATGGERSVHLEDVVIIRALGHGWAVGEGATGTGRNVVIRETTDIGRGLVVQHGGQLEVTGLVVAANRDTGIFVNGADAVATLDRVVVRDTETGNAGEGLWVQRGGRAIVTTSLFERNHNAGVAALHSDTRVTLTDVVIRGTEALRLGGTGGRGLTAVHGASVEVSRALIVGNREVGIHAGEPGTTATLSDVVIRDTLHRQSDEGAGEGLVVEDGAAATAARVVVSGNRELGVLASRGASLEMSDAVVSATRSRLSDLFRGGGVHAAEAALISLERVVIEGSHEVGLAAGLVDTRVTATDLVVRDTLIRECAMTTCAAGPLGVGVGVLGGANVEITRFSISASAMCGIELAAGLDADGVEYASGGTADLHEGAIFDNPIGANVQTAGFDVSRLMDRVLYHDNGRDLDMDALPTPEADFD